MRLEAGTGPAVCVWSSDQGTRVTRVGGIEGVIRSKAVVTAVPSGPWHWA